MKSNFSWKLKTIRNLKNISQEEFAKKLCVGRSTVSAWENGKAEPNLSTLKEIRDLLGVSYEDILD